MLRTLKRMKDNNPIDWIITEFEDAFLFSAYKKAVILSAIFYVFISFFIYFYSIFIHRCSLQFYKN